MVMQDGGSTPITLTEDAMVLLPGATEPVPAKNIIGFQSAFTRKTQELANAMREAEQAKAQAAGAMKLLDDFDEDPWGTLESIQARIVEVSKQQGLPIPPKWSGQPAPDPNANANPGQGQAQPPAPPQGNGMTAVLEEFAKRMAAMEQHITGMGAKLDVKESLGLLERDHPDQMKDPKFRQQMAEYSQTLPGAGLDHIFKISSYDSQVDRIKQLEDELKAVKREQLLSTPALGFGRANSVAGRKDVDEDEAMMASFRSVLEENVG